MISGRGVIRSRIATSRSIPIRKPVLLSKEICLNDISRATVNIAANPCTCNCAHPTIIHIKIDRGLVDYKFRLTKD